jgi:hypothetical protein
MGNKHSGEYVNRATGDVVANPVSESSYARRGDYREERSLEPISGNKLSYEL